MDKGPVPPVPLPSPPVPESVPVRPVPVTNPKVGTGDGTGPILPFADIENATPDDIRRAITHAHEATS